MLCNQHRTARRRGLGPFADRFTTSAHPPPSFLNTLSPPPLRSTFPPPAVYKEFQRKWDRANAAAAAAASQAEAAAARPSHSAPPSAAPQQQPYGGAGSYPFGSSLTTPCSSYGSGYGAGYGGTAAAGADWPPGYEALLQTYLEQELPLSAEEVRGVP